MMSDQEYVANRGAKCPHCNSSDIGPVNNLEMQGTNVWQEIVCGDCENTWAEVYRLIGWEA